MKPFLARPRPSHRAAIAFSALVAGVSVLALGAASCRAERALVGGAPETALAEATDAHDVATVRRLLAAGADPNKVVPHPDLYHSPWELALNAIRPAKRETVEIVKAMLAAHADPKQAWGEHMVRGLARRNAEEPLMILLSHPDPEVARAIMQAGLDPRLAQNELVMAVETGADDVAHVLVESGVDVNCHPGANTPLTAAIEARNFALMTYLEEHGAKEKP